MSDDRERMQALHNDTPTSIDFGIDLLPQEMWEQASQLRYAEQRVLLALAVGCGWRTDFSKGIHLTAEDGTHFDLPIQSNLNAKMFRSRVNTVVRHRSAQTGKNRVMSMVEAIIANPKVKLDPDRVAVLREAAASAKEVIVEPEKPKEAKVVPKVTSRKLRVVREEPWSAVRNHRGETYPSDAVMERHWSNDTVDYACRWEGCNFTDDSPRTVAAHNGAHKRGQGTGVRPEIDGVDPEHVSNPRKLTRIRNLAREIDGALTAAIAQGIVADPEWIAQWIIDHRIEALPSDGETPIEEMTAEQLLDKIAALCDRGRGKILREQVDTLQQQIDAVRGEMAAAQALADAQSLRASRAEGNLKTLAEILADLQTQRDGEETSD